MSTMEKPDGLEGGARTRAMATILLGVLISGLDYSIANVALPTLSKDFGVAPSETVWVVNAFQLAAAICILPFSSISERVGYRTVYLLGLLGFTLASAACACAPSLAWLVAARTVQGISAAAISGVSQAQVRIIYPRRIVGSGMSWYTLMVAVSASLGPLVASLILAHTTWPWLFLINLPVGAFALANGYRSLPESPKRLAKVDPVGAVLNALFFGFLIVGVDRLGDQNRLAAICEIATGLVAGVLLWKHQAQKPTPMLPVDLFRIPVFALSSLTSICSYATQTMALLALPFLVQIVLHRSAADTGFVITPWPLTVMVVARIAGFASDRYPVGLLAGLGLAAMAAGMISLVLLPTDPSMFDLIWRVALSGLGFGFFQTPNNKAMMLAAPTDRSGAANGAMGASRTLGQTIGAAITAAVFALLPESGPHAIFMIGCMFAVIGAILSLLRLGVQHERPATRSFR